ncbi:MAG TPA: ammonia-forming cytochrome c nitrite reductase subunit c552 [Armatimonadota bacterium]|jgi:nitrite reductase (cytochrome c-552)
MSNTSVNGRANRIGWFIFFGCALGVLLLGLLASSINERRAERKTATLQIVQPIADWEADNSKWGVSFPREYGSWESTKQMNENTKYAGSGVRNYLKADPRLVIMWAGYAFAVDYNAPRGHYHAVEDVTATKRVTRKNPATCWTCKSPDVPRMMQKVGGPANFYKESFDHFRTEIKNPIGCADCHNPKTMALQISRPALIEAFRRQGKDIRTASHQEMRSLVCAQCHVSYYFKDKVTNYLTFPWDKGLRADDFEKYYFEAPKAHPDFVNVLSGTPIFKLRHPDYEVFSQGVHSFRNVSCADCHMPYKAEGGIKYTDHQIRSPLYNIANSCQVCHRWSESEVTARVNGIQDKNRQMLDEAEDSIAPAHIEIAEAIKHGATDAELAKPRDLLSRAQLYWDYVAANNGMGFHAPQECARVLGKAIFLGSQARMETQRVLAKHGVLAPVTMPDISTEEKAKAYTKPFIDAAKAKAAAPARI